MPPRLLSTNHEANAPILVQGSTKVFVFVEDESPETLKFDWFLSEEGRVNDAISDAQGYSEINLQPDKDLDGQTLRCVIRDDEHSLNVSWPLEVLQ